MPRVMLRCALALAAAWLAAGAPARAQIITFDSGGLKFKVLTRAGVTIMFAPLPRQIHDYSILQVSISNGSPVAWSFKPEDFHFERADGQTITAQPAETVIHILIEKGSHGDVAKLMATYESALYGNIEIHSTNGFEARRQSALGEGSRKIRAAAAASAIALVTTRLKPGESTDGAIFYATQGKPLGSGKLIVNAAAETFEFPVEDVHPAKGDGK